MHEPGSINTGMLLAIAAKLQMILETCKERRITSSDPRYEAALILAKDLLDKCNKIVPAVTLTELGYIKEGLKELFKTLGEKEDSAIKGDKDSGH